MKQCLFILSMAVLLSLQLPKSISQEVIVDMKIGKEYLVRAIREATYKTVSVEEAKKIVNLVSQYSSYWETRCENEGLIPKEIYYAIIHRESRFDPKAKSFYPAYGLMQLTPVWRGKAPGYNTDEDMYNIAKNICAGVYVFNQYVRLARHKNSEDVIGMALACYNVGYKAAKEGKGKTYAEYVRLISKRYKSL